ncbi:unnamed protein product [Spirodela intermedia]|uniref:Uncharacterized protein n=1 Tax=Spirodela intermedia TaxID=51605 RepID=A0A7I8J9A8_SPIIN|nr:unnamed protein product [Spirodela intermedia]CAA6666684.1 unnamed protein product [Spirodela intermedia]
MRKTTMAKMRRRPPQRGQAEGARWRRRRREARERRNLQRRRSDSSPAEA